MEFNGWSESDLTLELSGHGPVVAGRAIGRRASSADADVEQLVRAMRKSVHDLMAEDVER